ncbi:hypothetical protein A0J61_02983 [Choanephora cucurbitarum]|uniref:NAD(P)-binding domain-containing protein n=1 Tax=Choanephora cucurbitarum TaxID=101091 RepID=A0A1C7NNX2_9FUNG|nr:hypothetical protein A0J61_02983 [Choanephora cucurbitarum]
MNDAEACFIIGGTSGVGAKPVTSFLTSNAFVTLLARDPEKAKTLFSDHIAHIRITKGSCNDLDDIKEGIQGHERPLLLVLDNQRPGKIKDSITTEKYEVVPFVSPDDINAVATVILQEDIQKHDTMSYDMTSDLLTSKQSASILSKLFGLDISYIQIAPVEKYYKLISNGAPAIDIVEAFKKLRKRRPLHILNRKPESVKQYLTSNQHCFH